MPADHHLLKASVSFFCTGSLSSWCLMIFAGSPSIPVALLPVHFKAFSISIFVISVAFAMCSVRTEFGMLISRM